MLNGVSEEIQRVLDENNFTQEDLCQITNMSQSFLPFQYLGEGKPIETK